MSKRITRVNLANKPWRVKFSKADKGCWGHADFKRRLITIDPACEKKGKDREILFHECLHVLFPQIDEEVIAESAECLDDVLDACGY